MAGRAGHPIARSAKAQAPTTEDQRQQAEVLERGQQRDGENDNRGGEFGPARTNRIGHQRGGA